VSDGGHDAIRSELTAPVLPHVIAARPRQSGGTLTLTGGAPPRMTNPRFDQ
jgi:hypothetical protein